MEDWQLLADYAQTGSETAFAHLVERHLGLVHALARRQVIDDALAADVAQAVFLLLARKAGSLGRGVVLSGWLFRTTRFVASRALRSEIRRQQREHHAFAMQELHSSTPSDNPLAPELDEALVRLSETDRTALLLRFAEGRDHREIGLTLGLNPEAAKKRVNRALERLRSLLTAQGVSLTLAVLSTLLCERLHAAPPAGLAEAITREAVTDASSGFAASLADQVLSAWKWTRWKWAAAFAVPAILLTVLGSVVLRSGSASVASSTAAAAAMNPAVGTAGALDASPASIRGETFRLEVVAADTGAPLPGVRVPVNFVGNGEWIAPEDLETDAQGICEIPLPRGALQRLDAGVHAAGYENRYVTWRVDWGTPRPSGSVLRLGRGDIVGGQVVDERSKPLKGVTAWINYRISDASWLEPDEERERRGFMRRIRLGTTDAQGRWICSTVPPLRGRFGFEFEHSDYARNDSLSADRDNESVAGRTLLADLRARKAVTVLRDGFVAQGQVADESGAPLSGARVATAWHEPAAITDAAGRFSIRSLPRGPLQLTATADGYAPKSFPITAGGEDARVSLAAGGVVRVRVVSPQGEPIAGATVLLDEGFGEGALGWDDQSDADGWVTWRSAPRNETRIFSAHAPGYQMLRSFPLTTDGSEQTVTLYPALLVVGRVVDDADGQPIARFKAIPGTGNDPSNFDRSEMRQGTNGHYALRFSESPEPVVRIEADGYATAVGWASPGPDGEPRRDFRLRRVDPEAPVHGQVLNPDGSPATRVEVALGTADQGARIGLGRFLRGETRYITNTDASGRFAFPPLRGAHTVAAISSEGFGSLRIRPGKPSSIRLLPFGGVAGEVRKGGQPQAGKTVILMDPSHGDYPGVIALEGAGFETQTDAEGCFQMGGIPAGDYRLFLNPGGGSPPTDETPVHVASAETVSVVLGEPDPDGRVIVGRLRSEEAELSTDWPRHLTSHRLHRTVSLPSPPAGLSEEERALWWVDWHQSETGREQNRQLSSYAMEVADDGTLTARGIPSGQYQLIITAAAEDTSRKELRLRPPAAWTGFASRIVTVPPADDASPEAPIDLGEIELRIQRPRKK